MVRFLPALALTVIPCFSQTVPSTFNKPPADVDDSLRARVTEFYNYHKSGKYRLAEKLVAEESRDGFYAANKPDVKEFKIGDIAYSHGYKEAKITIVAKMLITFMGAGSRLMDVPFPSYWKVEKGKWYWYIYNDPNRMTPFGKINPKTGEAEADPSMAFRPVDLSTVTSGVKADRNSVKLGDGVEKILLKNSLPGNVTIALDEKQYAGLEVSLDKGELKGGDTATVSIKASSAAGRPRVLVGVIVKPTNQLIQIEVR